MFNIDYIERNFVHCPLGCLKRILKILVIACLEVILVFSTRAIAIITPEKVAIYSETQNKRI